MGGTNVDLTSSTRKYSQTYTLSSPAGVKRLLRDRNKIAARRFSGDTAASDILIDLNSAIDNAGLTDKQAEAIVYTTKLDLTQGEAARLLGVSREAVKDLTFQAACKIAAVYRKWKYDDITVEYNDSVAVVENETEGAAE